VHETRDASASQHPFRQLKYLTPSEAVYPEEVIRHYRAFIDQGRARRPREEYREPTDTEWAEFRDHPSSCGRSLSEHADVITEPLVHENACVRCPLLRVDPTQLPRLEEIYTNLVDRLQEAKEHDWLGEVAAIETTMAAASQKLEAMRGAAARKTIVNLGMPNLRLNAGRVSTNG
jgi:hypothetical protein